MDKVLPIGHNRQTEHPVDELARIRREVRALKEREEVLRDQILRSKDFQGADHKAWLTENNRESWDHKALKEEIGMAKLRPFIKNSPVKTLKVERVLNND
jgi:hypothetical protein